MWEKVASFIQAKVEAEVKRINTLFSAFTSTRICLFCMLRPCPRNSAPRTSASSPSTSWPRSRSSLSGVEGSRAARRDWVGEMSGLFAHPAGIFCSDLHVEIYNGDRDYHEFFRSLLDKNRFMPG